jgi:hypothetical protein
VSLDVCLPDLERKGEIDVPRSREAQELYRELKTFYGRTHDEPTAAALASQKTVERLEVAAAHKKRNLIRQARAQQAAILKIRQFDGGDPAGTGALDPRGAEALFAFDGRAGHNDSVDARRRVIRGRAHGMIAELLQKHRSNLLGQVRNRTDLEDVVRELFKPGGTGNLNAKEIADSWSRAAEYLRSRFNEAGGQIAKLDAWGLPQSHSSTLVRAVKFDEWRSFILPKLDRARMIDRMTGEPFTDAKLELVLRDVYETISTDGWSSIAPGAAGGKMLANQHTEHRFLHFTDGEAWLAYHERFGTGSPFDAMMGHIDGMSRDIALMEILGPNPAATVRWLKDQVMKSAQTDGTPGMDTVQRAKAGVPKIQRLYDEITGHLGRPESEKLALGFSAFRSVQVAAKLGSALLSALPTDPMFGAVTRGFNGLPVTSMVGSYLRQLNPASSADRLFAVRTGLIAEEWSNMSAGAHRMLQEEFSGEFAKRLASGVLRASGLSAWTQAGRWAFGMEVLGHLTDQMGKSFDQLDGRLSRAMQRHGITPADWDAIRNSPIEEYKGAGWLLPHNIENRQASDRLMQWILTETDYAVPMADVRTRAMMNSVAPKGTWIGEIARTALLFKTFGISLLLTHGRRMIQLAPASAVGYAVAFAGATTIGGLLAIQLKEIAKGKDPRPIPGPDAEPLEHAELWGAAMLQGGGFGIFGDFLSATENRFGGGIAGTIAGPAAGTVNNVAGLGFSSGKALMGDDKANPGRDLVKVIKQETPGQSLWYSRLAFERLLADQLQEQIDPNYRQSYRAIERRAAEKEQDFWWEPGETSPDRAPELENAWGGNDQ